MENTVPTEDYALWTYEKLRYADTDRQGHVNNAVFATLLETGRVELLYNPDAPLHCPDCTFVIVSLQADFMAELTWPGDVHIGTRVAAVGRSSVTFEQGLFQNGRCAATARTVVVQVGDLTHRSHPLPDATAQRFSELMITTREPS